MRLPGLSTALPIRRREERMGDSRSAAAPSRAVPPPGGARGGAPPVLMQRDYRFFHLSLSLPLSLMFLTNSFLHIQFAGSVLHPLQINPVPPSKPIEIWSAKGLLQVLPRFALFISIYCKVAHASAILHNFLDPTRGDPAINYPTMWFFYNVYCMQSNCSMKCEWGLQDWSNLGMYVFR